MSSEFNNHHSVSDRNQHDDLARLLSESGFDDSSASVDPCRIERELKRSPVEVTQLVWLRLSNGGELGPYVRKLIDGDSGLGAEWRELWRAQQAGARFSHLPRVVYCDEWRGRLCVLMEYVPGPTLRELVIKTPPMGREELTAGIMTRLCDAASELHEGFSAPIIHRDITPSNVICSGLNHDEAVLVDLGIARTWKPGADADTTHFGTRAYAAPEQFGFGQTDVRTDVYSLGLVAFFCLTGHDPTAADRERDFAVPEVPVAWQRIIAHAAAFDPDDRYGTARDLRNAIVSTEPLSWGCAGLGKDGAPHIESEAAPYESISEDSDTSMPRGGTIPLRRPVLEESAVDMDESTFAEPSTDPNGTLPTEPSLGLDDAVRTRPKPMALLGKAWQARNYVVVPIMAIVVIASSTCPFQPGFTSKNPFWLDLYGYLVYMNYLALALGYLAMDKRWLRAHVSFFKRRTSGEVLKYVLVGFIILTVVLFALVV